MAVSVRESGGSVHDPVLADVATGTSPRRDRGRGLRTGRARLGHRWV